MPFGLPLALLAFIQAAGAAPTAAPSGTATATAPATPTAPPPPNRPDGCGPQATANSRTIVVCAPKPQGYRIDPDVLEARRERRNHGQPKPPLRTEVNNMNNCATVGPMGCRGNVGIDLVSAAGVLAQMAERASSGGDVGQLFVTEPQQSEYQLYVEAKKRREAQEAQAAAARARAAALAHPGTPAAANASSTDSKSQESAAPRPAQ